MAGQRGIKRSPKQRLIDREQALKLHMVGQSNIEIARIIGVDEKTVRSDLKVIEKDWQAVNNQQISEHRNRENAKLLNLESEYWAVYHESKKHIRKTTVKRVVPAFDIPSDQDDSKDDRHEYDDLLDEIQERVEGLPPSESGRTLLAEVTTVIENRLPDIRCLDGVRNCIEARCKLFGLPIPVAKVDLPDDEGGDDEANVDELSRGIISILDAGIKKKAEALNVS